MRVLLAFVLAASVPLTGVASPDAQCSGLAPVDLGCEETFMAKSGVVSVTYCFTDETPFAGRIEVQVKYSGGRGIVTVTGLAGHRGDECWGPARVIDPDVEGKQVQGIVDVYGVGGWEVRFASWPRVYAQRTRGPAGQANTPEAVVPS